MTAMIYLIPISLALALTGLCAFLWSFRSGQYDNPKGDAERILDDHLDEGPPRGVLIDGCGALSSSYAGHAEVGAGQIRRGLRTLVPGRPLTGPHRPSSGPRQNFSYFYKMNGV